MDDWQSALRSNTVQCRGILGTDTELTKRYLERHLRLGTTVMSILASNFQQIIFVCRNRNWLTSGIGKSDRWTIWRVNSNRNKAFPAFSLGFNYPKWQMLVNWSSRCDRPKLAAATIWNRPTWESVSRGSSSTPEGGESIKGWINNEPAVKQIE